MEPSFQQPPTGNKIIKLITVVVIVVCCLILADALYITQTTGKLEVTSSDTAATITISQQGRQMKNIGTGSAKVRLTAGTYTVIATNKVNQATATVTINKKQITTTMLRPVNTATLGQTPTIANSNLLTALLPFTGPNSEYKVGYVYNFSGDTAAATITITAPTQQAQQAAIAWIKSAGFDPTKLNIQYITDKP